MSNQLIVFIKNPVLGTVKTRLASTEGEEQALLIYQDLLDKCLNETLKVDAHRYLYYSNSIDEKDNWPSMHYEKRLQKKGADLGGKMSAAFEQLIQDEQIKTVIIGSDCYDLTAGIIQQAFDILEHNDLVFGPANDGGYYLMGMKNYYPELFKKITWSSNLVLEQSLEIAKKKDLSFSLLEELIDLDTIDDVKKSSYPYPRKN